MGGNGYFETESALRFRWLVADRALADRTISSISDRRADRNNERLQLAAFSQPPRSSRGSNSRAFQDPLTLERVFPGLREAPAGAIVAVADNILDFTGPARELTASLTQDYSKAIFQEIETIDPRYRFESLGFPTTQQGQNNQLNGLRFDRAAAYFRIQGELRPLQVETLRFIQRRADAAYERGVSLMRAGKLNVRLSQQEALGNYIDREVRRDLRAQYGRYDIEAAGPGPVRVNRRENDSSGTDLTFRRPDARVGKVAFDVTLSLKTPNTNQVRGFFATDFRPDYVIIVRPRQIGSGGSYAIPRPGK